MTRPPTPLASTARRLLGMDLSDLAGLFAAWLPRELLDDRTPGSRRRVFTRPTTFWAFLSQVLTRSQPCREAVRKLQVVARMRPRERGRKPRSLSGNTSAYCQARLKQLPLALLRAALAYAADLLEALAPPAWRWHGLRVAVVDGSTCSMPDTATNQACYPQPSEQKPGCGFPVMKFVGLFSLATGAWHALAHGDLHTHERTLFRHLWDELAQRFDLVLGDGGFAAFADMALLLRRGVHSVFRAHQRRPVDFRRGRRLGRHDHLVHWRKPLQRPAWIDPRTFDALPDEFLVREVRIRVPIRGFRTCSYVIVTTLLDARAYPPSALAELYFRRWSIELHLRDVKTTLGLDVLRCQSPGMVQRELWMHAIAYTLVRALMLTAARQHGRDIGRLSFKGTLDTLRQWAPMMAAAAWFSTEKHYLAVWRQLLACLARDLVPERPGRSEPRAKKRRPKNYQLLTRPRHKMGNLPHRNRPLRRSKKAR